MDWDSFLGHIKDTAALSTRTETRRMPVSRSDLKRFAPWASGFKGPQSAADLVPDGPLPYIWARGVEGAGLRPRIGTGLVDAVLGEKKGRDCL